MHRILRTSSFRLAAAYAAVTALAFLVLYLVTGWISSGALDHQIRAGVEAEFSDLMAEYSDAGRAEFLKELDARSNVKGEWSFLYYYGDQAGRKIAGNIDRIKAFDGWRREAINQAETGQNSARDNDHQMIAFGKHLADRGLKYSDGPHIKPDGGGIAFIDAPEGYEIELIQMSKTGPGY